MAVLKFPKTLGETIDLLAKKRDERLELARQVKMMQEDEAQLEAKIMADLSAQKLTTGRGLLMQATIVPRIRGEVLDWDKLFAFMAKKKLWGLVQKRLAVTAWREMVDEGDEVPGVTAVEYPDLSLSRVK